MQQHLSFLRFYCQKNRKTTFRALPGAQVCGERRQNTPVVLCHAFTALPATWSHATLAAQRAGAQPASHLAQRLPASVWRARKPAGSLASLIPNPPPPFARAPRGTMGLNEDERAARVRELQARKAAEAAEREAVKRRIKEDAVRRPAARQT